MSWEDWEREHAELLQSATPPQQVLLEAAVRFLHATSAPALLLRMVAFFLLHACAGLSPVQVGAAVGRTDRAMRTVRSLSAEGPVDLQGSAEYLFGDGLLEQHGGEPLRGGWSGRGAGPGSGRAAGLVDTLARWIDQALRARSAATALR